MALASMAFARSAVTAAPEILYYSDFTAKALTLDTTAFTSGLCKAGTPIAVDGKIANTSSCAGILLCDVYSERPLATIVVGGYINTAKAKDHSGVELADAAKTALKNVVFM